MDADDLDQLLDDVERRFCRDVSVTNAARADAKDGGKDADGGRAGRSATKPGPPTSSVAQDVDALLEELLDDDDDSGARRGHAPRAQPKQPAAGLRAERKPPSQCGGRKCCPVFVGGSAVASGVGTAVTKRSCDRLRCTSCDFRVLTFDDCEWDPSCDYLFFRNNMPDQQKLRAKLKRRRGVRAYSCQCSWFSASEALELRDQPRLRWVCGKHLD